MQQEGTVQPARLAVDYPVSDLNRSTTFFRLFAAIPIILVLGTVSGWTWQASYENGKEAAAAAGGRGVLPDTGGKRGRAPNSRRRLPSSHSGPED